MEQEEILTPEAETTEVTEEVIADEVLEVETETAE